MLFLPKHYTVEITNDGVVLIDNSDFDNCEKPLHFIEAIESIRDALFQRIMGDIDHHFSSRAHTSPHTKTMIKRHLQNTLIAAERDLRPDFAKQLLLTETKPNESKYGVA